MSCASTRSIRSSVGSEQLVVGDVVWSLHVRFGHFGNRAGEADRLDWALKSRRGDSEPWPLAYEVLFLARRRNACSSAIYGSFVGDFAASTKRSKATE